MDEDIRKLIAFLAEDCGWPLEDDQIDRSAWPVNNAELGLNDEVAIDSVEIFELRPLTTNQPWGVFFLAVKGTSDLSMALLRKLLRGLVKKKRASADTSNLQQWDLEDLMFVCSLDEPKNTTRYFAHFKEQEKGLPKLMIGARWQDSQPENEIKAAKLKLKSNLKWPDNEADIDSWREQWAKAFPIGHKEVIKTSTDLSKALAKYAVIIKQNIPDLHGIEMEDGPIHQLHKAFREALIKDLSVDDFADMVAQTITYGLFSASATGSKLTGIETLSECIPSTNPFLRDLFAEFSKLAGSEPTDLDFDDLAIDELISMLNHANINAIMADFGTQFKGGKEDPVIHFYENFLKAYDKKIKISRGVFYTPQPAVSFIVRSVDESLRLKFGLVDGLADISTWEQVIERNPGLIIPKGVSSDQPFVQILDPATGTGTFLVEVISLIHMTMIAKWKGEGRSKIEINDLWNHYVPNHLLPRLYGYELLMAPFAVAHLKIGLKLLETGYRFIDTQRLQIYLTNTLERPSAIAHWIPEFLAQETKLVNQIKHDIRFTVVIGNPPYSKISSNLSSDAREIVERYRFIDGKKIKEKGALQFEINLQDDYVKFFRFCESAILSSGAGVLGLITNNGYLSTPTLRGMRDSLLETFCELDIIDLHGHLAKGEIGPDGRQEENIFDIKQGVSIAIGITLFENKNDAISHHVDVFGSKMEKYQFLQNHTAKKVCKTIITPILPFYFFVPHDTMLINEWNSAVGLQELFPNNSAGIITARDALVISSDKEELASRMKTFSEDNRQPQDVYKSFGFSESKRFDLREAQAKLRMLPSFSEPIRKILHRPFDVRYFFYDSSVIWSLSRPMARQMESGKNIALVATRQVTRPQYEHVFITKNMIEIKSCSHDRNTQIFPLFTDINESKKMMANIHEQVFDYIARHLGTKGHFNDLGEGLEGGITPRDLLDYIYGILHSLEYRKRYFNFLRSEFPRIPITNNLSFFRAMGSLGKKLISLHLLKPSKINPKIGCFLGDPNCFVEKLSYDNQTVWIDNARKQGFTGVTQEVWNFRIGGYRVCEKWLKDRRSKGMILNNDSIEHYQKIVNAISETIQIMDLIDATILKHGGWPLVGTKDFNLPTTNLPIGQTTLF